MARFATVDANNGIVGFTSAQQTYNPQKGDAAHPAPWRSLPAPPMVPPAYDPAIEIVEGPTYIVNPADVTEAWTKRALTPAELSDGKDNTLSQFSNTEIVAATALFNHENRIRALEGKAAITKAQFITGLKALL